MFTFSSVSMFGKIYFFHCFILAERKFIRIVMIAICCVHLVKTEVKSSDHSPCFLPLCCLDLFFSFAFPVFPTFCASSIMYYAAVKKAPCCLLCVLSVVVVPVVIKHLVWPHCLIFIAHPATEHRPSI